MATPIRHAKGFTLVEMIMVMVITGIIGGIVAMFIRAPVQGYVDSARRADLTDIADTAVRRMARDIRSSVANSVRPQGGGAFIEFLPSTDGGRYRAEIDPADPASDALTFGADTTFDVLGAASAVVGNLIVMGSADSASVVAYGAGLRTITALTTTPAGGLGNVTLSGGLSATLKLPSQHFDITSGSVTYSCVAAGGGACATDAEGSGTCQLRRYSGYAIAGAPSANPGGTAALLADNISQCSIDYTPVTQRLGMVSVRLSITQSNESVNLYNEIHVNNAP